MGELQVIIGCMYAGKTAELLRRVQREMIAGRKVQLFKPAIDSRYDLTKVTTHDNIGIEALPVANTMELVTFLKDPDVIAIDELQFFDASVIGFCLDQVRSGKKVICSALATDFLGEPFRFRNSSLHIGDLLPHAIVTTLRAICTHKEAESICGAEADMTQRLIDGEPASRDSPLILIGGKDSYEARCRKHHQIQQ